ncbi:hypothetical protein KFE25_001733 [Diacronema lutheri]|uniref:Uncharacterized protein n=1 Tax=Diacronema lutheri TaxID=2081491 RepID=A0A8J5XH64_DIALT|nr:hypothetical protein KFE25_001733 [Diacronema lutheri]
MALIALRRLSRCGGGVRLLAGQTCAQQHALVGRARSTPLAPLLGGGAARGVAHGAKTSAKMQKARDLQRRLQAKRPPSNAKPATPAAWAALDAKAQAPNRTLQYVGVAATVIVVGGIAYAWSTLVDLLRKLERMRQEAVKVRVENGGVPPLATEPEPALVHGDGPASAADAPVPAELPPAVQSPTETLRAWAARAAEQLREWLERLRARSVALAGLARDRLAVAMAASCARARAVLDATVGAELRSRAGERWASARTQLSHKLKAALSEEQPDRLLQLVGGAVGALAGLTVGRAVLFGLT